MQVITTPNAYADVPVDDRAVLLKIHGEVDLEPTRDAESFVVSEDDYIAYLAETGISGVLPVTLAARLRRSHFLFLGYRLVDWSFRVFLHRLWPDEQPAYRSWAVADGRRCARAGLLAPACDRARRPLARPGGRAASDAGAGRASSGGGLMSAPASNGLALASPYKGLATFDDSDLDALALLRAGLGDGSGGGERDRVAPHGAVRPERSRQELAASCRGRPRPSSSPQTLPLRLRYFGTWAGEPLAGSRGGHAGGGRRSARAGARRCSGRPDRPVRGLERRARRRALPAHRPARGALPVPPGKRGAAGFVDLLPQLVLRPGLRVNVLLGIRDDALAQLDVFKERIPGLFMNSLRLEHLDRDAGRAAILGPLARYAEITGAGSAMDIEPELVEEVLDQVSAGWIDPSISGVGEVAGAARADADRDSVSPARPAASLGRRAGAAARR